MKKDLQLTHSSEDMTLSVKNNQMLIKVPSILPGIFKSVLAMNCGDPTQNLTLLKQTYSTGPSIPGPTNAGSYLQIKRISGYFWQDLLPIKAMNCSKLGSWFPFHESCVRMPQLKA